MGNLVDVIVWGLIFFGVKSLIDAYSNAPTEYVQTTRRDNDDFVDFEGSLCAEADNDVINPATGLAMCGGCDAAGNAFGESGDTFDPF